MRIVAHIKDAVIGAEMVAPMDALMGALMSPLMDALMGALMGVLMGAMMGALMNPRIGYPLYVFSRILLVSIRRR